MANTDIVAGLRPLNTLNGVYNGKTRKVIFASGDSTAAFIGDLVAFTGTADATGKIPVVTQAAAGTDWSANHLAGVIVRFEYDADDMFTTYRKASTERVAYITADDDAEFWIQEDGNAGIASAGLNSDIIVGSGDTYTGMSGMELDSSEVATTATLPLRLISLHDSDDNEVGTNAKWIVKLNGQAFTNTTGK